MAGYGLRRRHVHDFLAERAAHRVLHLAADTGVEGVVATDADVDAGMYARATLTYQDLPGIDLLAAVDLYPEALCLGVTAVARAAAAVAFEEVLLVGNGDKVKVGAPLVSGAKVKATVVSHGRGEKVKIFKFRRRKHSQKSQGHRQNYTEVRIDEITG